MEKFVMAMAREAARQQRISVANRKRQIREAERQVREAERDERVRLRDETRYQKQQIVSQRETQKAEAVRRLEDRQQEADRKNDAIADRLKELEDILIDTLAVDDTLDFDSLRVSQNAPTLKLGAALETEVQSPQLERYLANVRKPSKIASLMPGMKGRHKRAVEEAENRYAADLDAWQKAETKRTDTVRSLRSKHDDELNAFKLKVSQRDAEVDSFRDLYFSADPDAVIAYNTMVLERSAYPEDFPRAFSIGYSATSKQLVIEFELPTADVVPHSSEFRFIKARDTIEAKPRKATETKALYQDLVASIALRTLHEVFEADQAQSVDTCCFNGFVHTVDPATGRDVQPHLISVRTTKPVFSEINLSRVDKTTCLRNLGAAVSRHAAEAQPVKPIVEFNMMDARFIDQTDLVSGLGSAPNLMDLTPGEFEILVANLFGQMGLESKLTRSSRDGGVDCIAYDKRPILGGKVVIQAKRYRHTVGVSAVRDLYGTMMNEGANKGILVTTSGYGPDAFNFASDKPIELIDGGGLLYLLQEIGTEAKIIFPPS
ncbi:restriction endonuclease [Agrobacterium tumefaciens]|uniref:restriction endonuclease n=1 Tax=Agrobacterium tumefaciens TaxID=358 RepID=UPI003B9E5A37